MEKSVLNGVACDLQSLVHTEDKVQIHSNTKKATDLQEKFDAFYIKYESFMYYIANDVLKDNYLAEDAVQIALMNIYKNFQGVGDIDSVTTKHFVITVTKRVAIDLYRQQQKQKLREPFFEDFEGTPGNQETEFLTGDNEVMACIRRLPQKYADALFLKYVQGYRSKEIAEMFGCTPSTIRSHLFRGKKLLRAELKKSGIDIKI